MGSPADYFQMTSELIRSLASIEDKITVMQLTDRIRSLQEERDGLAAEVKGLREELARKKRLETMSGATYVLEGDGSRTGPVCKRCYDERDLTIMLVGCPGGALRRLRHRLPRRRVRPAGPGRMLGLLGFKRHGRLRSENGTCLTPCSANGINTGAGSGEGRGTSPFGGRLRCKSGRPPKPSFGRLFCATDSERGRIYNAVLLEGPISDFPGPPSE